jgi:hypothetical protein
MTQWGWLGVWLLVLSVVVILVEGAMAGIWTARLSKRSRALSEQIATERGLLEADLQRLRLAVEETGRLWQPYRRLLRWVRHPLVIALMQSFIRRSATAR